MNVIHNKLINYINQNLEGIPLDKFIEICLFKKNGYYKNNQPIGRDADFTTAPEISQLFGELIGLYIFDYWKNHINRSFNLIELGPGRGTLMQDLLNISSREQQIREKFAKALSKEHLQFFNNLQFSYTWKDYFFVHAGIDPNRPLDNQREIDMIWTRAPEFLASDQYFEKMIVHGHTPNEIVEEKSNRINLDTGAVYPELGKLSCMFIDVKKNRREFFNT